MKGKTAGKIALGSSVLTLCLSLFAACRFQNHPEAFLLDEEWIKNLGIHFSIAVDGINILLILLTGIVTPFIILASLRNDYKNENTFYSLLLLMQASLFGVFLAKDAFLFYVFYELALIPIYFICALWGGKNRIRITLKFFIYTLAGSLFMLAAIIFLGMKAGNFSFASFYALQLSQTEQNWLFAAFFAAFAVKIPIFPFHTWQPDTYTDAPVGGTMLLSGIMLKMGLFGLIVFILPICPLAVHDYGCVAMVLCIIGIIYASIIAMKQDDLKTLIAYSSIAHVGLIAAGIFSGTHAGMQGALLQMLNHGINVVALFFLVDYIERTTGTRLLSQLSGISNKAAKFAVLFMIILLGSVGLPLTNGFVGEFLLLMGVYNFSAWMCLFAGTTIILGAVYMLRLYKISFLGEANENANKFQTLTINEYIIILPLAALVLIIGVYPNCLLNLSDGAVQTFISTFIK